MLDFAMRLLVPRYVEFVTSPQPSHTEVENGATESAELSTITARRIAPIVEGVLTTHYVNLGQSEIQA